MTSWRSAWRSLRKAAGLDHVRFHDGCHTALTRLAEKGQPDWVIQAQMGHVSPVMMRTYSHMRRKALDEAAAALEPSFKLKLPRHKAKKPASHESCDRLMSRFTSQWNDLKEGMGQPWTRHPPKAGRPSAARARETESQTRLDRIGFGSSGWARTFPPEAKPRAEMN